MEKQEKTDKLLCVLNSNLDKVVVDGTAIKFQVKTNGVTNTINLYKSTKNIPAIKEIRYFFGFIPIQMTIKKSYEEPCAVIWSHFDGYSFSEFINLEIFTEIHQRAVEIRDKTFIKKLNTYCDEEKK